MELPENRLSPTVARICDLAPGCAVNDLPKSRSREPGWVGARLGFVALLFVFAGAATGRPPGAHILPNFRDADFIEVAEAVSKATGRSFLIHPLVRARVTMQSATEMSPEAFYDAFLSLLPACGFVAVPGRGFVTILPGTEAPKLIRVGLRDFSSFSCER